jgi:hypothetical protein
VCFFPAKRLFDHATSSPHAVAKWTILLQYLKFKIETDFKNELVQRSFKKKIFSSKISSISPILSDNVILIFYILHFTFGISRHLRLPRHHQKHITLHHPFSPFPQCAPNHFIDVTKLCLFCILFFSIATDPSKNVIYFYLKF